MKFNISPLVIPVLEDPVSSRFVSDVEHVRNAVAMGSHSRAQPATPMELGVACFWRAIDANVSNSGSFSLDAGAAVDGAGWSKTNIATPAQGRPDPRGGCQAWSVRDNSTSGYHSLAFAGWGGTISTLSPCVYEVILKPIGTRWIWIRDAYDASPAFGFDPVSGAVYPSGSSSTARSVSLGDGWWKITCVCAAGTAHIDGTYGLSSLLGDNTGATQYAGDGLSGYDLFSAWGYQYSIVTSVPASGTLGASLTGNGTNVPLLVPNSAANGVTGFWQRPGLYGILYSNNATLRGYYNPGNPHTTAVTVYCELAMASAATLMASASSGSGFSIGIVPGMNLWVGTYNTAGEWTLTSQSLNVGEPYCIVTVYDGSNLSLYVNGEAWISNLPITFGSYTSNQVMFLPQQDLVMTNMCTFNKTLTAAQVASLSEYLLADYSNVRPSNQIQVANGMLWHSERELRLSFAELHLKSDGRAQSIKIRSQNQWHSSALSAKTWGPEVIADGTKVMTMLSPDRLSEEVTAWIPSGTRDIVVRDSLCDTWKPCCVDRVTGDGLSVVYETTPKRRITIWGDSVSCGANADAPTSEGWTVRLRDALRASYTKSDRDVNVTTWACGGLALANNGTSTTLRAQLVNHLTWVLNGTDGTDLLLIAMGTNDATGYWSSWGGSASAFWTAYADVLSRLHTAKFDLRILCIAPHNCPASPSVANLNAIRAQIVANAEGMGSWCKLLNLGDYTIEMDATDSTGLHPTTAGQLAIYNAVRNRLNALGWLLT